MEKERKEKAQGGSEEEIGFMGKEISNLASLLKDKEEQLQQVFEEKNVNVQ